jgi:hypothetical protein
MARSCRLRFPAGFVGAELVVLILEEPGPEPVALTDYS